MFNRLFREGRGSGQEIYYQIANPKIVRVSDLMRQILAEQTHQRSERMKATENDTTDIVALTGSALINHSLDELLALCPPKALVMLLGPSTPLSPVLFEHGATILSGTRVIDEEAVLRTVAQGAHFPQVEGVRLLTMAKGGKELF